LILSHQAFSYRNSCDGPVSSPHRRSVVRTHSAHKKNRPRSARSSEIDQLGTRALSLPPKVRLVDGEHDVFGDGTVVCLPSPWRALPRVLRRAALPVAGSIFVDFGGGKGRILLSALAQPFARVIGVEFSPYLCRIARNNLCSARLLRRRNADAQVVCTDAVEVAGLSSLARPGTR
jgi:hypothetical protein